MPQSRRLTLVAATAAATLVALPAYATVAGEGTSALPAATPTRITPTGQPGASTPVPQRESATPSTASGGAGGAGSGTAAPATTYSAPNPSGAIDPPEVTTITPSSRFAVDPSPPGGKRADETWPDAKAVFTLAELAQVIPGLTAVDARECRSGELDGGRETAQDARCILNLTIKGEPTAVRSRLVVNIRGFGTPDRIGRAWSSGLADQQERSAKTPARLTFYRGGSLGASGAYTDGTTTRVLVQRPGVAGEIWFSGIGFTRLKSDYVSSRKDFRERVSPALVRLLATKMAPA
jgi:hypothetical protein